MRTRKITVGDIQAVTDYSRDQLRGLLDQMDQVLHFVGLPGANRVFSAHEFLVIVLCCELETTFGMKRKAVVSLATEIANVLSRPRPIAQDPTLILILDGPRAHYLDGTEIVREGLVVPLTDIFMRVDSYLLPSRGSRSHYQQALNLGPSLLTETMVLSPNLKTAGGRD
jgi:hypothetical protein